MSKKAQYGNDSIKSLKGADRVRQKPAVIFGDDGLEGCQHSVFEIISNSIDEARAGFGNRIIITRFLDKSIEVRDFGRGMPVDYNNIEHCYNWTLLFCELYAGGKYDQNEGGGYEFALGLNGLGLCSTQYASEYMDAEIHSGGFCYTLHFEKGENIGGLRKEEYLKRDTGTRIKWRPDLDVFTDIDIPLSYYQDVLKRQAVVNNGLKLILKNEISSGKFETFEYLYENGIVDYLTETAGDKAITPVQFWECERTGRDREDKPDYRVKIYAAVAFSDRVTLKEYYHNSSFLEYGGAPEKAVRAAFVSQIDSYLKQNGKYNKTDSKITFQDIEDCLLLVVSSFSTQTSYENQTKKAITNKFIYEAMTDFLKKKLEIYFIETPDEANKIAEQVLVNKRSRENAEKTRLNIKKKLESNMDLANMVQKFVDCRTKDVSQRELYIVEGDSALGSVKLARDPEFQAVMPIRGKILNCLKVDYARIFKSEIITDLIKVLGCGVEVNSKANKELSTFHLDGLKWDKIIICTDADVDGFQIRTLVLTMLYRLTPTLIEQGYVYIAESPLFEIETKDMTYFAYTEKEKSKILEKIGDKKYTIQRSKGLGENEPDMMNLTTMNPATRRLIKVNPSDAEATADMFNLLLGDNLQGRKDYIAEYGADFLEFADIS